MMSVMTILVKSLIVKNLHKKMDKYKTSKNLTRKNRKPISYKITKPQVNTALELLKQNEQLTMNELAIDITPLDI
jgi:ribonuclease HII